MYKKISLSVFTIIILFSSNAQVFAEPGQKIDIKEYYEYNNFVSGVGEVIQTDKIIFEIGRHADVHVKHIIVGKAWDPTNPKLIEMLPGKHSNLEVTDEDGDYLRPIGFVGETFEESKYIIVGQKPFSAYDLVAEYDLENFLELDDNGVWTKQFVYPHDVIIYFDDEMKVFFANSRGIDISEVEGINCMGCDITVEFFDDVEPITKKVIKNETKLEEFSNTGKEFILEIFSGEANINLDYIEELNYFSFPVDKSNQLIWMKIPLDLILSPYHVYLTEFDQEVLSEIDQIRKSEFGQTETHANLSFKAPTEGVIHVVGSTEAEHMELLEALAKRAPQPETKMKEDVKEDVKEDLREELYKNWESTNSNQVNSENNTIIFIIVGVVAVIIIGIIIKLKKN
ncbi:MAG: hypothetical protein ISR80_05625 [Nitrosopumilus sp.]|nr:hypothetical protein [Candidatus Nitrosopelagicus sp.]MBL7002216.1 hypothetical protein [Nitrosopumilus sp.]